MSWDYPRFCTWCGAKVPKESPRNLCRGHLRIAEGIDAAVRQRMDDAHDTPMSLPVIRNADSPP